ncbi:MAG: response regulator [Anaerolineae bacterium]|nr:response regulator [Anaerolineae bacterium]
MTDQADMQTARRILVVDDDKPLCNMMATALANAGYAVATAFSGEEALDRYREQQPDLVILDFAMPGMNGFEVCTEIRRLDPPHHRTLVVFLTAYAQTFLVSVDFHVGVDGTLTKPILPSDLVAHVKDLFASRT